MCTALSFASTQKQLSPNYPRAVLVMVSISVFYFFPLASCFINEEMVRFNCSLKARRESKLGKRAAAEQLLCPRAVLGSGGRRQESAFQTAQLLKGTMGMSEIGKFIMLNSCMGLLPPVAQ